MPKITIKVDGSNKVIDVDSDTRLVLAIERAGVDVSHRCGGHAKCTTCRVKFHEGEPKKMSVAERTKLTETDRLGQYRLSCQILCDHDMVVEPLKLVRNESWDDPGKAPDEQIPDLEWTT